MNQIQRLDRIPPLNHTRYINLTRPLGDHLDINVSLR